MHTPGQACQNMNQTSWRLNDFKRRACFHLNNGDSQDEPGRGAVGVAVEVPLAVDFPGQCFVGNMPDQPLGHPQAYLISETAALQLSAPLQNGPPETVGALAAHLARRREVMAEVKEEVQGGSRVGRKEE